MPKKTTPPVRPFGVANDLQIKMVTRTNVSYKQIAKQTGVTRTAVRKAVRAGLERQRAAR